ncbi:MAG: ribbon-helix-helix domain-containing protein [Chloroflexi bacterium]|nr:ribbon-helix-helix domain-containing protein [Chloroflexota bacterium]
MIRTQVQLSESQMQKLKDLARRRGVPLAALIREGADHVIRSSGIVDEGERRRRALAAAGRFHSGHRDLAAAHDRHLAEAMKE